MVGKFFYWTRFSLWKTLSAVVACWLQAEVNYLGQLHHPNLVKLIGYCLDGDNRLLVYEYMPKGSLENHLFRSESMFSVLHILLSKRACI